jgi:hypothetical protein
LYEENGWNKYHVVSTTQGVDSIIEQVLFGDPDFSDLGALTKQIERGALKFIADVEGFLIYPSTRISHSAKRKLDAPQEPLAYCLDYCIDPGSIRNRTTTNFVSEMIL